MTSADDLNLLQRLADRLPQDLKDVLVAGRERERSREEADEEKYDQVLDQARLRTREHMGELSRQQAEALAIGPDLLDLPPSRRRMLLLNRAQLLNTATATQLLQLSWQQRTVDPKDSESLAELALEVLSHVPRDSSSEKLLEDLKARAWGQIGNARRIQTDQRGADGAFKKAFVHLERGTQDPTEDALLSHWIGSLQRDQRRFSEAVSSLRHASLQYRLMGDDENQAQALINLGYTYREAGDPEKGLRVMQRAEDLLPQDHELLLYVRHNQIDFLIDLGRHHEADALLTATRPLYAHAPEPLVRLRLPWVEGRIARHTDRAEEAEYLFQQVRQGFVDHGIALDAAMVSLELAEIYVEQGRNEELKELAQEMVTVFRSRNVEREATAALLMLHHAASAERATLRMIRDIADRLRERAPQAVTPLGSGET